MSLLFNLRYVLTSVVPFLLHLKHHCCFWYYHL